MATPNRAKHQHKVKAHTERSERKSARSSPALEGLWGQGAKPLRSLRQSLNRRKPTKRCRNAREE